MRRRPPPACSRVNLAKAAPLYLCQDHLASSKRHARSAIVTNSGCANACTGPQGMADAREMAQLTAAAPSAAARITCWSPRPA